MACSACGKYAMNYVNQYRTNNYYIRRRGAWGMCFYYRR